MALSTPRSVFGIHSVTPYNISTGEFYGTIKVLQNSSLALTGELLPLNGGSSKYPWAVEDGLITAELSLSFSQYDDFLVELMLGKKPTANAAETDGSVSGFANKSGTSLLEAATGIASIGITTGDEADLKFAKYVLKVASATTVDLYASSDADFARGTDGIYVNDLLLIEAGITIADTGATIAVADYGLEITSGSGTIAMTIGDTAEFSVRPPNAGSMDVVIGGSSDSYPEWGCIVMAQKRGGTTGEIFELDLFKVKAVGLPIGFATNEWSTAEVTAQAFYDSSKNGVFSMRHVKPV